MQSCTCSRRFATSALSTRLGHRLHNTYISLTRATHKSRAFSTNCREQTTTDSLNWTDTDSHPSANLMQRSFQLVVASTQKGGIGLSGDLPWGRQLTADLKRFKQITTATNTKENVSPTTTEATSNSKTADSSREEEHPQQMNAVIMGRKTWESLPQKYKPLPNRINIIITQEQQTRIKSSTSHYDNVLVASSLSSALSLLSRPPWSTRVPAVFVIGGASLITESLSCPELTTIHQTLVFKDFQCDTFMPPINQTAFRLTEVGDIQKENDIHFQFLTYERLETETVTPTQSAAVTNPEEMQYLDLVSRVLRHGQQKGDRTGTGTLSLFGAHMRFSLSSHFPLLTTKRVFWRGVVEELLWLIRGCTDSKQLAQKNVHIWDDNGSRAFLDKLGFTDREEGDLGPVILQYTTSLLRAAITALFLTPLVLLHVFVCVVMQVYGFQWRHFGAEYVDCHTDYTGKGVDQLAHIIATIRSNPNDRRLVLSAWNPVDIPKMALPPCHVLCQFFVCNGSLSCQMYQRSCDLGLGVPFNIASYSLLTVMMAHVCQLTPGEFVYCLGDAHVYNNHISALKEQCMRETRPFPTLQIKRQVTSIDDFVADDFVLNGYYPHEAIKMKMAV